MCLRIDCFDGGEFCSVCGEFGWCDVVVFWNGCELVYVFVMSVFLCLFVENWEICVVYYEDCRIVGLFFCIGVGVCVEVCGCFV